MFTGVCIAVVRQATDPCQFYSLPPDCWFLPIRWRCVECLQIGRVKLLLWGGFVVGFGDLGGGTQWGFKGGICSLGWVGLGIHFLCCRCRGKTQEYAKACHPTGPIRCFSARAFTYNNLHRPLTNKLKVSEKVVFHSPTLVYSQFRILSRSGKGSFWSLSMISKSVNTGICK